MSESNHRSRLGLLGSRWGWSNLGLLVLCIFLGKEFRHWYILLFFAVLSGLGFLVGWLGERRYKGKGTYEADEHGNAKKRVL